MYNNNTLFLMTDDGLTDDRHQTSEPTSVAGTGVLAETGLLAGTGALNTHLLNAPC